MSRLVSEIEVGNIKKKKGKEEIEKMRDDIYEVAMNNESFMWNELQGFDLLKDAIIEYVKTLKYDELKKLWIKSQDTE